MKFKIEQKTEPAFTLLKLLSKLFISIIAILALAGNAWARDTIDIPGLHQKIRIRNIEYLNQQITESLYRPRTCVVSLIASEAFNQRLEAEVLKNLFVIGYNQVKQPRRLFELKNGLKGFEECLIHGYEDVTVISHSSSTANAGVILRDVVTEIDGESVVERSRVPPAFFRNFTNGKNEVHSRVRQLTLIVCNTESVIRVNRSLRDLVDRYGLNLRVIPSDLIDGLMVGPNLRPRSTHLIGWAVAENAQPEWMPKVGCLYNSILVGFTQDGEVISCLRGRYSVQIRSALSLGFQFSNHWIVIDSSKSARSIDWRTHQPLYSELSLNNSIQINFDTSISALTRESYGFGASILPSVAIRNNHVCYDSLPQIRSVCFQNKRPLQKILESIPTAELDAQDAQGRTALMVAAIYDEVELIEELISANSDPNLQDRFGMTMSHLAAALGRRKALHTAYELVGESIDLNIQDSVEGNTPLHWAVHFINEPGPRLAIAKNLARYPDKLDVSLENSAGQTVLDLINANPYGNGRDLLRTIDHVVSTQE